MGTIDDAVAEYLQQLREGQCDAGYHGLLDLGPASIPRLIEVCKDIDDGGVKETLVEVIWQSGRDDVVPFLASALYDEHPAVWKQALDGLVAIATPAAEAALRAAQHAVECEHLGNGLDAEWLQEALNQINASQQSQ